MNLAASIRFSCHFSNFVVMMGRAICRSRSHIRMGNFVAQSTQISGAPKSTYSFTYTLRPCQIHQPITRGPNPKVRRNVFLLTCFSIASAMQLRFLLSQNIWTRKVEQGPMLSVVLYICVSFIRSGVLWGMSATQQAQGIIQRPSGL